MNATDADLGENGTIARYIIVGSVDARLFRVDETGTISVTASLDRELASVRRFQVVAVDRGSPPRSGSALVVVNVDDVDDCEPAFTQQRYEIVLSITPLRYGWRSIVMSASVCPL